MKKYLKNTGGITLISLVITIIILLILAAISIQALTSQGLFGRANDAKRESEIANIKEQIVLDIYEKQLEPPVGSITEEQLKTILEKHGTIIYEEDGLTIKGITTAKGYEILLKDIYGGETAAESVPDGATVTPVNDITTWLKTGEISKQYSYTTIEQVIADSACTQSLMNNENAMKYLARSTEFADAICASETTMTSLGKSTYVDNTVLKSDYWFNKCLESQYYDKVFKNIRTIHAGAYENITMSFTNRTITTNSDGNVNYPIPNGTYTFTGSVSGKSFTKTITSDTTDVYVMPDGALYWYGNECTWITGGWTGLPQAGVTNAGTFTKNTNNFQVYGTRGDYSYVGSSVNKIIVSNYNKLYIKGESTIVSGCNFMLIQNQNATGTINTENEKTFGGNNMISTVSDDIINKSGEWYTNVISWGNSRTTCYAIWLE